MTCTRPARNFTKNWFWAIKRAYISVFEPVRPVSIPAYEMRGQAKAILDFLIYRIKG
ncbi:hypothetical protein ES706_06781 [subsurface metagenome]